MSFGASEDFVIFYTISKNRLQQNQCLELNCKYHTIHAVLGYPIRRVNMHIKLEPSEH
jgi:hypothetical protein